MTSVGDFPDARLCHALATESLWAWPLARRAVSVEEFPIDVRRPEPGTCRGGCAERTVVCGVCGREIVLVAFDIVRTTARRRRWGALSALGLLVATAGVLGLVFPMGDVSAGSPLLGALAGVIGAGVVAGLGFLRLWWHEDGLRYPMRSRRASPGHSVTPRTEHRDRRPPSVTPT